MDYYLFVGAYQWAQDISAKSEVFNMRLVHDVENNFKI
jgi:hypothetical protein